LVKKQHDHRKVLIGKNQSDERREKKKRLNDGPENEKEGDDGGGTREGPLVLEERLVQG